MNTPTTSIPTTTPTPGSITTTAVPDAIPADAPVLSAAVSEPTPAAGPLLDGRLRDLLAGKKIVMTGVTGFIGEQLLWKILTELPDTTPAVMVRRKRSARTRGTG